MKIFHDLISRVVKSSDRIEILPVEREIRQQADIKATEIEKWVPSVAAALGRVPDWEQSEEQQRRRSIQFLDLERF